mgnify:CR=1 FL=1
MYEDPPPGSPVLDLIVTLGGIAYGAVLVSVVFFRNRFTEALRIDALIVPKPTDATRVLNPVIGLMLIGYNVYSLLR